MSVWNEANIETALKMWQAGHSAREISLELKVVSRSAILGKLHRMGVTGRARPSNPAKKKAGRKRNSRTVTSRRRSSPAAPRSVGQTNLTPPPIEAVLLVDGSFATILTITDFMCKWPIGDPGADTFKFCGRRTGDEDEPYCKAHSSLAYQASRIRGSKTRALGPVPTSRKRLR